MSTGAYPLRSMKQQVPEEQVRALEEGRAFVDGTGLCKVRVTGTNAPRWLNDLLTADIEGLAEGRAVRSLLLTPTGYVRADVHVLRIGEGFLLLQRPDQPAGIDELLRPYVLSSDVHMLDESGDLGVASVLDPGARTIGHAGNRPSILGEGMDLVFPAADSLRMVTMLVKKGLLEVGSEAVEVSRIRRGIPRFPVDVGEDSLPAEAGLESAIDFAKGCFLGQESVAKVRNLGHPPGVVRALRAQTRVDPGEPVLADGEEVGAVTSAAPLGEGSALLARVSWDARAANLATPRGDPLLPP
jgi:folate-binding protein YgfZ